MSLNLINPVGSSSTGSYRIHQNSLLNKAKELTSGLKDKLSNPINDQVTGCKFKNSASIITQIRSNTVYATNILSKTENDLEHIGNILEKIKEVVASATTNANSSDFNHLNDIYQNKVAELVKYIDNSRFDGRNLFDGSLQDLKVRVGEEFDNINTIQSILFSYLN